MGSIYSSRLHNVIVPIKIDIRPDQDTDSNINHLNHKEKGKYTYTGRKGVYLRNGKSENADRSNYIVNGTLKTENRSNLRQTEHKEISERNNERSSGPQILKSFSYSIQNFIHLDYGSRTKSLSENNISSMKVKEKLSLWKFRFKRRKSKPHWPFDWKQGTHSDMDYKKSRSSIQDTDGGFFEKFGSLLRQKSEYHESTVCDAIPLAPLSEITFELDENVERSNPSSNNEMKCTRLLEEDSGTETQHDSDSEQDDSFKHENLIEDIVGMNINELYAEILYELEHNLGCSIVDEESPRALFEYVQDAFKISNEVHNEILSAAKSKQPPEIRLNVEIIKAENLLPKDSNGFSDPFVTLYLDSNASHRYNTSVKSTTLNPTWEEHFSLPIKDNPNNELLLIEVWDFDAAETVGEKMNKFFEIKGAKGFGKLMKEIAVTAYTGKHDNELIGRTSIPLKSIPVSGIKVWQNLEKGSKTKSRGSILINMAFSAEKNNKVASQEHRHLLKILLMHELETSKVANYWWSGKYSAQGEAVLKQHAAQSGLSVTDCALAEWSVYTQIHHDHPLAFGLFNIILDKILPLMRTLANTDDALKLFWEGCKRLLPSCFSSIRKLRKKTAGDKNSIKALMEVLDIISKIDSLDSPEVFELLPKSIYGWSSSLTNDEGLTIRKLLRDAVDTGAMEWFEHVNENNDCSNLKDDDKLQHLIKLIQLIRSDLQRAIEYYDKPFQQKMQFGYAQTLFIYYQKVLVEYVEPMVTELCQNIKRIQILEEEYERLPDFADINMGTSLFELYLVLKRFTTLGVELCPAYENMQIYKYHEWFTTGVSHWLDISAYKALLRIEKAIDLDKLVPVDETVKYSSSAVDTLTIFYQIKVFWQQLDWPDVEGAYMFIGKIVDDICRCCVFYADRMSLRVEKLHYDSGERFEVTREWCLAINNIDYVRQSLSPFVQELGVSNIIEQIGNYKSCIDADRCAMTIKNVIENAVDTERNKILELIEIVARKMTPAIRRFLTEGAEILHEDSNSMERLMLYLENSLGTLHCELNELNFERILEAIWCELATVLHDLVKGNIDKRRPPAFFANLRNTLHIMVNSFKLNKNNASSSDKETLDLIEKVLELHAMETGDLIHQYYLERFNDQKSSNESLYGQLTVRGTFRGNTLELEIMNARNLIPMDSNGLCDSFVKVHFMPTETFLGVTTPKTSVKSKTLFPLYDETFSIALTEQQCNKKNSLLVFSIKDKDLFGMSNQYLAECYLTLEEIESSESEQIHMILSRPEYRETDCIRVLEHRQGDKQAREFIKKLRNKSYNQ